MSDEKEEKKTRENPVQVTIPMKERALTSFAEVFTAGLTFNRRKYRDALAKR